jgi:hypothetical protein
MPPEYAEGPYEACEDGACCEGDWGCGACYAPRMHPWFRGEYLLWWEKSANLPPLVSNDALDVAGVNILFGGDSVDPGSRSGARFTLGSWLSQSQEVGIEATYMFIGNRLVNFHTSSDQVAGLARPFFNVSPDPDGLLPGKQDAQLVLPLNGTPGVIDINLGNDFQSFELLMRQAMFRQPGQRVDFLAGYRYSRFSEILQINETTGVLQIIDSFGAGNQFNGAELGISAQTQHFRWSLEGVAKIGVGATRSTVAINGTTKNGVTIQGGFLALPSNIGVYEQTNFTMLPEIGATLGCNLTPRMKLTCGYSLLYWGKIVRPGDQIDAGFDQTSHLVNVNVNPTQFPVPGGAPATPVSTPAPQARFTTTDFWAQGLSFGLDCRF